VVVVAADVAAVVVVKKTAWLVGYFGVTAELSQI